MKRDERGALVRNQRGFSAAIELADVPYAVLLASSVMQRQVDSLPTGMTATLGSATRAGASDGHAAVSVKGIVAKAQPSDQRAEIT